MATLLIRGVTPRQIFAQYMGRMGGLTRGRDGNMHMGDLKLNIISIISALAATVPVAAGCALGLRYLGKPGVCFTYFGDGATSRGDWHEGVNFASVQKLPIIYVCNNNQYAYSTPLHLQMACANIADKGAAYGMAAEIVDGNDVFAVYEATERALAHCRAGLGPYLLECKTFRMTGHSAHDGAHYVPKELFEEWAQAGPHRAARKDDARERMGRPRRTRRHPRRHPPGDRRCRRLGRAVPVSRSRDAARRRLRGRIGDADHLPGSNPRRISGKRWSATRTSS